MDPIICVGDFHRCHASYIALMSCLDAFRSPCSAPPDGEGIPKDKAVGDLADAEPMLGDEDQKKDMNKKDDLNYINCQSIAKVKSRQSLQNMKCFHKM